MDLSQITPLVLTFNEAPNLRATLEALSWAKQIIIVDSGSTDATLAIAAEFPNVTVHYRAFDHFSHQCNFGLSKIETEWTLSLDADYRCPPVLVEELKNLEPDPFSGYSAAFRYCIYSRPLRSTLYPPRTVLYKTHLAEYVADGHAHRVQVRGSIGNLFSKILHDDRKPLSSWISSQQKYAHLEADKLLSTSSKMLAWKDRLRKGMIFAPFLTLVYCLFVKGLILDGWPGIYYTMQRVLAEMMLSITLLDRRIRVAGSE